MRSVRALVHAHVGAAVFAVALVCGAALHLRLLPIFSRLIVTSVNRALEGAFLGHVHVDRVAKIGLSGTLGLDGHVDDAAGRRLITLEGIDARLSTLLLLRSLASNIGPINIDLPDISIARADVLLERDDNGVPVIARAFDARTPKSGGGPGRSVRLALPHAHIAHLSVHVTPSADADLDDATVSLLLSDQGLSVDLGRAGLALRDASGVARASGIAQGHFEQPASGARLLQASWEGAVGGIVERANATLRGDNLDASLDVSPVGSAEVCALLPQWPIAAICSAHAEAHGTLAALTVGAHASVGGGTLDISGPVTLGSPTRANLHVDVRGFDGRSLVSPVACSNIDVTGEVSVEAQSTGEVDGRTDLQLTNAQCGGHRLPSATVSADFARTAVGDFTGHADIAVRAPGAPSVISLRLAPGNDSSQLSFEAASNSASLEEIPELHRRIGGSGRIHAVGTIDLRALSIDARATASFSDLRGAGDVAATTTRVEARASGRLLAPSVDLDLESEGITAPAVALSAVSAQTRMTLDGGVALHDVRVDFAGEGAPIHMRAVLASLLQGTARLDGAVVEGLGEPLTVAMQTSDAGLTLSGRSAGIDLARVASFTTTPIRAGKLALNLDATVTSHSANGHIELELARGVVGPLHDVGAHVQAMLNGRGGRGQATVSVGDIGTLEVHSTSLIVGRGGLLTAAPWRSAWGALQVEGRADLAKLVAHLPRATFPVGGLQGQLEVTARLGRDSQEDMTPEVDAIVRTKGLVVRSGTTNAWRIDGIDPVVHVAVNGDTGATAVNAQLQDATGAILKVEATSASVPYGAIFSDGAIAEAFLGAPFSASVEVPSRSLASMPAAFGLGGRRGDLEAHLDWRGAITNPIVSFTASLMRGHADPKLVALPVDLALTGHYEVAHLDAEVRGSQHGVEVVDAEAHVSSALADWLARPDPEWNASARAKLEHFPLRSFDVLDDRQVRGTLSGELSVDGLHDDARASAQLTFDDLQVGDVHCKASQLSASVDEKGLQAVASLDQADGGSILAQLRASARWGAALLPQVDPTQPAFVTLQAKKFRAELLLPWIPGMTELDGVIDGNVSADFDSQHQILRPRGTLSLKDGKLEVGTIGTEFHAVSGKAVLSPDGVVRFEDVVARGTSGRVMAAATVWTNGLAIGGASATVRIPNFEPLPLVFGGVLLGKIDGRFDLTMKRSSRQNDVDVNVPSMTLELPSTGNRDVQDLGEIEGIHIGRIRSSEFVAEYLDAANDDTTVPGSGKLDRPGIVPTLIDVHLGQDVEVRKGSDLDVRLEGRPRVTLGPGVRVSGQVKLQRGSLDVQGKAFEIESGTLTFVEADPANPQVVLAAGWSAPDGTRIHADFVGPLKTGKVTLWSEPARPQNEILALILFGTTDQQSTGGGTAPTTSMAATAGGVASQPLNQALGGVNHALDKLGLAGGISTKVDTSTANPRPEVEVQIARDISLQLAWVLGQPPPGTDPDTAFATIDWRFLRNWALETTVGDAGSSIVDVLWQHRY
jgi:translocation and assembly module TamB